MLNYFYRVAVRTTEYRAATVKKDGKAMSRKSKITLAIEGLKRISDCPDDLFDTIEPMDAIFEKIKLAESNDTDAIALLSSVVYDAYGNDEIINKAMLYFLAKGVDAKDPQSARATVICAAERDVMLDKVVDALKILNYSEIEADGLLDVARTAMLKATVASAVEGADFDELTVRLPWIDESIRGYVELYLIAKRKEHTGVYKRERIIELTESLGMPRVANLYAFLDGRADAPGELDVEGERGALIDALEATTPECYRELWLKCIYQYCEIYLGGNYAPFATVIARALESRRSLKDGRLHLLAWRKYVLDNTDPNSADYLEAEAKYLELLEECRFKGIVSHLTSEDAEYHRRSAMSTPVGDVRRESESADALGYVIEHTKNRYVMSCELTGHAKRAKKHMWEITTSIRSDNGLTPLFKDIRVVDWRNTVTRGGVTPERCKKLTQVLCLGTIETDGRISPFEIDLILDISYVSATKCDTVEIKIRSTEQNGEYLTMHCQMYLC